MTILYNRKDRKTFRHDLRANMTKAETILWTQLKGEARGVKIRRQASIGPFIVDFYCSRLHLAIEVDGPTHFESVEAEVYDSDREKYLRDHGIVIFRCTNTDVYENLSGVIEALDELIEKLRR